MQFCRHSHLKLFSYPKRPAWLWGPPTLLFNKQWVSFLRVKQPEREVNLPSPSSAEAKNEWSYTSSSPISLHGVDWENFNFTSSLALGLCAPLRSGGCLVMKWSECDSYHSFHPVTRLEMRRAVGLCQLYVTSDIYIKPELNFISTVIYIYIYIYIYI
jgi:hypothetical protein